MSMENHGGMISIGETPDSFARAIWQTYHQRHLLAKQEKRAKGMMNFALRSISFTLPRDLNMQ
jgi:hypothetical protein